MEWGKKRQFIFGAVFIVLFLLVIFVPGYFIFHSKSTCFDGVTNGNETGIDCGGLCSRMCLAQTLPPLVRWQRVFKVSTGIYNAVAYVDNPNSGVVYNAPYTFKGFDAEGAVVFEKKGETYIPSKTSLAIFEGPIEVGSVPVRVSFTFGANLDWQKKDADMKLISIEGANLIDPKGKPRLSATARNISEAPLDAVELIAIVYDSKKNAVAASRTLLDSLSKGETKPVVFTWPEPLSLEKAACLTPVDVVLAIDRSSSMQSISKNPPEPLSSVKEAARIFTDALGGTDRLGLVSFATTGTLDARLTTDTASLVKNIQSVRILSGVQYTNIGDAIHKAVAELGGSRHRAEASKVLILLTDGEATYPLKKNDPAYPGTYAKGAAFEGRKAGVALYTIGLGKSVQRDFLESLAGVPQNYYAAPTSDTLKGIYSDIATHICTREPEVLEIIPKIHVQNSR